MSTPVNHHYVSECHLKEFFNTQEKRIYLYDKEINNFYHKPGTKKIFSLNNLNTRLVGDVIDQQSMEYELRVMFEDNFSKHIQSIKRLYDDHSLIGTIYNDLNFLALMALVGEYRNPHYKKGLDNALASFDEHFKSAGGIVEQKLKHDQVLYSNLKGYIDIATKMLMKMDPMTFAIVSIKSADHFIVPDTSGFLIRENFETGRVIQLGLPISDKLFILGRSVAMGHYPTTLVEIKDQNSEVVFRINSDLVNYAYKTVACKNEGFLRKTIKRMRKVGFIGQHFFEATIGSPAKA
ncbi:Protein of unknown function [Pedobacter steynii]|uniref:DUF4238 domain-containing protein n=1 Tax=Pedobacter steynii TaxID=430522 RepID=A0A1G9KBM6_9SPHI|nr:DUF4238 domain-containing protein [Pedobacter steynii]NQX38504.1 DUF4238 domain-containing protein [Pedobacter steynii]SDL47032.1 Protein of unknown function [Pedobacter steynii]